MIRARTIAIGLLATVLGFACSSVPASAACHGKTIKGNAKANTLRGTCGPDKIVGKGGDDELIGLAKNDKLIGGAGDDTLQGGKAADTEKGGPGDDVFISSVKDASDVVEGADGSDTVRIGGTGAADLFTAAASAGRQSLSGPAGSIVDAGGVESLDLDLGAGAGDGVADQLAVNGTDAPDTLQVSPGPAGLAITGLGARLNVSDPEPLDRITLNGLGGDDSLTAGAVGALIGVTLDGGGGGDAITGGDGADALFGGTGGDTVDGNAGNDTASLGAGNDSFTSDPGDGADVVEGDADQDALTINGSGGADTIALASSGGRVQGTRDGNPAVDIGAFESVAARPLGGADQLTIGDLAGAGIGAVNVDLGAGGTGDGAGDTVAVDGTASADVIQAAPAAAGGVQVTGVAAPVNITSPEAGDRIVINGLGGDDALTTNALLGLILVTLDGGDNNDTINGGPGADSLLGEAGVDTVDGNGGNDTASLGAGTDTFIWDPGDGSDVVEGDADLDTLRFNGSGGAEIFAASANGARLLFTRNVGNVSMDVDNVEDVDLNALGGADTATVNDLAPTDIDQVNLDLGVNAAGDSAADQVFVNGTGAADIVQVASVTGVVQITGLGTQVNIAHPEAANDRVTVGGLAGTDTLSGGTLAALIQLTLDGGDNNDTINGGNGADTLIGGNNNDTLDGNGGNDVGFMGAGDDTFVWDPGDGSDIVEGQGDIDTLHFNGSGGAEIFAASANGGRLLFTRNVGNIVMDTDDVENVDLFALGGADTATINDLSATDVVSFDIDLGVAGAGDASIDAVTVNGTAGNDLFGISGSGGAVAINNPNTDISLADAEPANDTLTVNNSAGDDIVGAPTLGDDSVKLTVNGGTDDDILDGSQGSDTINGDAGNDIIKGENGNDTINCGADTDSADGGGGAADTAVNCESVTGVP